MKYIQKLFKLYLEYYKRDGLIFKKIGIICVVSSQYTNYHYFSIFSFKLSAAFEL